MNDIPFYSRTLFVYKQNKAVFLSNRNVLGNRLFAYLESVLRSGVLKSFPIQLIPTKMPLEGKFPWCICRKFVLNILSNIQIQILPFIVFMFIFQEELPCLHSRIKIKSSALSNDMLSDSRNINLRSSLELLFRESPLICFLLFASHLSLSSRISSPVQGGHFRSKWLQNCHFPLFY